MSTAGGKASWPELVGKPVRPAMLAIKNERPEVSVEQLPEGAAPTRPGFRSDRVLVFYHTRDELGRRVAAVPIARLSMGRATAGGAADEQKSSWPELVGLNSVVAMIKIHGDRPDVVLELHTAGESVPPGFDGHRVRLFLAPGTADVAQTPVVG